MDFLNLPTALEVNGTAYDILSDFRDALGILTAFEDPDLSNEEKRYICLYNLYPAFLAQDETPPMPESDYAEAYLAAVRFLDGGRQEPEHAVQSAKRLMDWEQDAPILFPAVNRIAGKDVRAVEYLHWWTFLGFFMEIREGVFSTVLSLRRKKYVQHKKFEKEETRFWKENRQICELRKRESAEVRAEKEMLKKLLGG